MQNCDIVNKLFRFLLFSLTLMPKKVKILMLNYPICLSGIYTKVFMSTDKKAYSKFVSPKFLFLFDYLFLILSYLVLYVVENGLNTSALCMREAWLILPVSAVCFCVFFYAGKLFRIAWSFSTIRDFLRLALFTAIALSLSVFGVYLIEGSFPLSVICYLLWLSLLLFWEGGIRIAIRHSAVVSRVIRRSRALRESNGLKDFGNTLIIGAGGGARRLMTEIKTEEFFKDCTPVCAVDDSPSKKGFLLSGIPVVGTISEIPEICEKYQIKSAFLAISSLSPERRSEILSICISSGIQAHSIPSQAEMMSCEDAPMLVKKVRIEDLLGRKPIQMNLASVMSYVENKTVLVTGAGGSIGSELCRQIAAHSPKKLILFDIYENGAYDIQNEIKRNYPSVCIETLIGSVRDFARLSQIFNSHRPDIVYHAAAHKHVPLMEDSPNEAVKNNVFGTLNVVRASDLAGVKRFVMISTDKAVNPTNVMGATKRMCEMIVQAYNRRSKTEYVAVRFGNVLGSNGSVIPLFERQIAAGGPMTVTHPDIIRYFMTIPEAVSLVLQAGAEAHGGEIFVLDMGAPVKIDDLARNMIRLSGLEPDRDIQIVYTGLRPGEKLYEELLMDEEGLSSTDNKLIHIGRPIEFDEEHFFGALEELEKIIGDDSLDVRKYISELVPTFTTPEKANTKPSKN